MSKIHNVLAEFEGYSVSSQTPYDKWGQKEFKAAHVAVVGVREYIFRRTSVFSETSPLVKNRRLAHSPAWIGGKRHYGHPDFLNATFMNTRGGMSKTQKGLHLNEDIYAIWTRWAHQVHAVLPVQQGPRPRLWHDP